ncbi:MAG: hypothetical protein UHP27_07305 [Muribaculaceae bacterium]|nr:hypothetical protein [Muribaculaceae bacterium]
MKAWILLPALWLVGCSSQRHVEAESVQTVQVDSTSVRVADFKALLDVEIDSPEIVLIRTPETAERANTEPGVAAVVRGRRLKVASRQTVENYSTQTVARTERAEAVEKSEESREAAAGWPGWSLVLALGAGMIITLLILKKLKL